MFRLSAWASVSEKRLENGDYTNAVKVVHRAFEKGQHLIRARLQPQTSENIWRSF